METPKIIRQCCNCREWMDEESKTVAEARGKIEYVISHCLCKGCSEKLYTEEPEPCADTVRSVTSNPYFW